MKKLAKYSVIFFLLFSGGTSLNSCNDDDSNKKGRLTTVNKNSVETTGEGNSESTKQADQDVNKAADQKTVSDTGKLKNSKSQPANDKGQVVADKRNVDSLVAKDNKLNPDLTTDKKEKTAQAVESNVVSDKKAKSNDDTQLMGWINIIVFAILLGLVGFCHYIYRKMNLILSDSKKDHQKILTLQQKLKSIEGGLHVEIKQRNSRDSNMTSLEISNLSHRLNNIERQMEILQKKGSTKHDFVNNSDTVFIPEQEKTGYFGLPSKMSATQAYFKRLEKTKDPEARFSVKVEDNNIAYFTPLVGAQYLNDLKSNDTIKMVLDIRGCAPSESTQMKVVCPGKAKSIGDRWEIINNAIIELSK